MAEGLKGLIPRTRELGRLRMGERGDKGQPVKRTTWRLTSPSEDLLNVAAGLYGGTVEPWTDAPTQGRQYQLATDAESIEVLIPLTDNAVSQAWEMWSGGGCVRRCDGERMSDDSPCACPADLEARMAGAAQRTPTACKPHTRFNVLLPDVPDLGFWRLETSGYNAAVELPGSLALYRGLAMQYGAGDGLIVRAHLAIEARTSKKDGQTRHFTVPVIRTPNITPAVLMTGESPGLSPARVEGGLSTALVAGEAQEEDSAPSPAPPASQITGEVGRGHGVQGDPGTGDRAASHETPPAISAPPPFTDADATLVPRVWQAQFLRNARDKGISDLEVGALVQRVTGRTSDIRQVLKTEAAACEEALAALVRVA